MKPLTHRHPCAYPFLRLLQQKAWFKTMVDACFGKHCAPPFRRRLPRSHRVMTLEPGTCCFRAASYFIEHAFEEQPDLVVVPTFAEGILRASGHPADIVLLPHVHETCGRLTTDIDWHQIVDLTFPYENPPLLLARRPGVVANTPLRCATIHRLKTLLDDNETAAFQFAIVDTTQDAARACASPAGPEVCVTNQHGAERYGLDVVRVLKHMTIWWLPFRYGQGG